MHEPDQVMLSNGSIKTNQEGNKSSLPSLLRIYTLVIYVVKQSITNN